MLNSEISVVCALVASIVSIVRNKFSPVFVLVLHTHTVIGGGLADKRSKRQAGCFKD